MLILHCEDSLEGIFTAIYDAFVYKKQMKQPYRDDIEIAMGEGCLTLFAEEQEVVVDAEKVEKTVRTIQSRLGFRDYQTIVSGKHSSRISCAGICSRTQCHGSSCGSVCHAHDGTGPQSCQ